MIFLLALGCSAEPQERLDSDGSVCQKYDLNPFIVAADQDTPAGITANDIVASANGVLLRATYDADSDIMQETLGLWVDWDRVTSLPPGASWSPRQTTAGGCPMVVVFGGTSSEYRSSLRRASPGPAGKLA